jgi:RNA polymerase-binding transcription factor DksA
MEQKLIEELKEKLEAEKISLEKELERFAKKDDSPKGDWETKYPNREDGDSLEEADEVEDYNNLLPVEYSLETKLRDVNLALDKIKNGTYGTCENCGQIIEEARLRANPEAKLCLKCNDNK